MIFYPIKTLVLAGITELAIIVSEGSCGQFIELLKNGEIFPSIGLKNITYKYQENKTGGIADALSLTEDFSHGENIAVMLGDNTTDYNPEKDIQEFKSGCKLFLHETTTPEKYGVAEIRNNKIISIEEKPENPKSNMAVTGLYLYDNKVFDYIKKIKPSKRNQLEISDINNIYIQNNNCSYSIMKDSFWMDAGEPDSLFKASEYWYTKCHKLV
jgi:glucose-1-phosphate thymidylyltransferase